MSSIHSLVLSVSLFTFDAGTCQASTLLFFQYHCSPLMQEHVKHPPPCSFSITVHLSCRNMSSIHPLVLSVSLFTFDAGTCQASTPLFFQYHCSPFMQEHVKHPLSCSFSITVHLSCRNLSSIHPLVLSVSQFTFDVGTCQASTLLFFQYHSSPLTCARCFPLL